MLETLKYFINHVSPRFDGRSPTVVNDKKFHTILNSYLIKPPVGYGDLPFVVEHKKTCECFEVPSSIVKMLAGKTKNILDKINGKFTYAAFVFTDANDKQEVAPHLHIQALLDPIENYKEIILFVPAEDSEYEFLFYEKELTKQEVLENDLHLRNENDKVHRFLFENNIKLQTKKIKNKQFGVFNGQTLIHGGELVKGSGIWVVLSMCTCDVDVPYGDVVIDDY